MEALIKQHGFQPAEFLELSFKASWPMLEMSKQFMDMGRQMMAHLPEDMRAEHEAGMAQAMRMCQFLEQCMTDADKQAAKELEGQLLQHLMHDEDDGMDPAEWQQMMEMMQQN